MRFEVEQRFEAPLEEVEACFVDPALYEEVARASTVAPPQVLETRVEGHLVHQRIRYRFTGSLSSAARRVVDPERISWVQESVLDTTTHLTRYRMVPDTYGDRFRCGGEVSLAEAGGLTTRVVTGDLRITVPLVGRAVEGAIVSGLRSHLEAEAAVVRRRLLT